MTKNLKLVLLVTFIVGSFLISEEDKLNFYVFYIGLVTSNMWISQDKDE